MKYFGRLSNNFIEKWFEELCWEIVQRFTSGRPMNCFRRVIQQIHLGGLSNVFISEGCPQIKQIFCLETIFIHGLSMCEGVGEDLRHWIGHVDIRVAIMNLLEYVCFPLHEHLGHE